MMKDARYSRQMSLPRWGSEGQQKLKLARVLVIGAGGLGSGVLTQLTAAGVGHISIFDHDLVALSNLHRQTLFLEGDIGSNKAESAASRLREQNSSVDVFPYPLRFDAYQAEAMMQSHDLVIDCTDDPATRLLIDDAAAIAGIPCVYAALFRFEGQVTVFHHQQNGSRHSLRSAFPDYSDKAVMDCATAGIAGPVAAHLSSIQAMEALKLILGIGVPLIGSLLTVDLLDNTQYQVELPAEEDVPVARPYSWTELVSLHGKAEADAFELNRDGLDVTGYTLIDIREEYELQEMPVGLHYPMGTLMENISSLPASSPLLLLCDRGVRSAVTARQLRKITGRNDIYSLNGGIGMLIPFKRGDQ